MVYVHVTIHQNMECVTLHGTFNQTIGNHVTGIKPHQCCKHFLIQQVA